MAPAEASHFPPDLETAFEAHYYATVQKALRLVSGLLALLCFAYAVRDYLDTGSLFLFARVNGIPAAAFLLLHALTYWRGFLRVWMPAAALGALAALLSLSGLARFIAAAPAQDLARSGAGPWSGQHLFFTLQTCILMVCFAALRLPFRWSFVVQLSVLGAGVASFATYLSPLRATHTAEMRFLQPVLLVLFVVLLVAFVQEKLARAVFLANHQLDLHAREIAQASDRLQHDLEAAARVQHALLPASLPQSESVCFAYRFRPCDTLGGDILNIFPLDAQHIGFYLLDVTGHGVAASLLSVSISHFLMPSGKSSVLSVRDENGEPRIATPCEVLAQLNSHFSGESTGLYFTMFYGILHQNTGQLRYVNAGHPLPLYLPPSGELVWLESGGLPIGIMEDAEYTEGTALLKPGSRLFLYSDGVTEARNAAREQFGEERMANHFAQLADCAIDESLDCFHARLRGWMGADAPVEDDISLVALEMVPAVN